MTPTECTTMSQMMGGEMGQMMNGGMMGSAWAWGGIGWYVLLAFGLVIVVGLALAFVVARRPTGPASEDPREILRRRFARGELSADEFADALKSLG